MNATYGGSDIPGAGLALDASETINIHLKELAGINSMRTELEGSYQSSNGSSLLDSSLVLEMGEK